MYEGYVFTALCARGQTDSRISDAPHDSILQPHQLTEMTLAWPTTRAEP
ncbi:MAG: hypothetical protein MK297_08405 [Planctomycetes bacterium]|nr:hypothetical protein [Planctomycetota bacterium]